MNKVTTINLNGNAYQLEESGYEALRNYLDSAARRLEGNPDKGEIIADIERAIADKVRAVLGQHKTVVATAEIETIIAEMGPVQDPSAPGDAAGTGAAGSRAGAREEPTAGEAARPARRLYKIREGGMIGGVCNGIAAYLNVDVTIVRILFSVLTVVWGFLLYIIMLFLIPAANTPAEKAAAMGGPSTAEEFIRRAKEGYYEGMKTFKDKSEYKRAHREWRRKFKREMHTWGTDFRRKMDENTHEWSRNWHADRTVHSGCRLLIAILAICAIYSLVTRGSAFGMHLLPGMPLWLGIVCVIVLWKLACGLSRAMTGGVYYGGCAGGCGGLWSLLVWAGAIFFLFWVTSHHEPRFHEALHDAASEAHSALDSIRDGWNKR